jgi:hypothetical protein
MPGSAKKLVVVVAALLLTLPGQGSLEAQARCNCDCNSWQQADETPDCRSECDSEWKKWQCGPYLETGIGPLDTETQRYQAELQQLGLAENEVMPMVYAFKISSADLRAGQWEDLENLRDQQAGQNLAAEVAEIEAEQAARGGNYDAETQRYQAALEQAGYSQAEVNGLTEIFSPAPEVVRQVYWNEVNKKLSELP